MSRWFRFYAEALDDPKVQKLDPATFKHWVNILCLACKHEGFLPDQPDIAFALRIDEIATASLLDRLLIGGLIDVVKGGPNGSRIAPHGWQKRQYKSDDSTARVKRFRERSKAVSETPPEADTESETEDTPPTPRKRGMERAPIPDDWKVPPIADLPPRARACAEQWTTESYETHGEAFKSCWQGNGRTKADWDVAWASRVPEIHDKVMRAEKAGNAPPGEAKRRDPGAGQLLARYKAGEISFEEFDRQRSAREATVVPFNRLTDSFSESIRA